MATLEVHDGRGRVEIVEISRDHTALFGSDPKCDVVLNDPQVLPFHGRLRYKAGKYRAEAFPEADSLTINGKKVVAASLQPGDEIKIGPYKMYLVDNEAGAGVAADDRTREQAPRSSRPAARGMTTAAAAPTARPVAATAVKATPSKPTPPPKPPGPFKKFVNVLMAKDQRPGEERVFTSPLALALIVALTLLVAAGIGLYSVITRTTADNQYNQAQEAYNEGSYVDALKKFDLFLNTNPREPRAPKARVLRAMASVHQYVSMGAPNWTAALEAAKDAYKKIKDEKDYPDQKLNLADLVLKTAEGLADRAKNAADPAMLPDIDKAVTLHDSVAGEAAMKLRSSSRFPGKLAEAHAAVEKAQARKRFLAQMDEAIKGGSATDVYSTRDALVARYPDFATDKEVIDKLKAANDLVKKAVALDPAGRPGETKPHPEPLGPPLSLVLRSDPTATPASTGPIVYALAQGHVYALDGNNGAPIWHVPVGLSAPFAPIPVAGQKPSCLLYDSRHGELVRLDGRTGKLMWRQSTGETITDPPLILGNQVAQVTPSGKLLSIDLASGDLKGTLNLGRAASRTPAADESGAFFYIAGSRDILYVIARDPLSCAAVEYLGQPDGSIPCAPARVGPYLIVPENDTLYDGKWTVFLLGGDGSELRALQTIPITGYTWGTPPTQDKFVWSVTDRGALTAFEVGDAQSKTPLVPVATTPADLRPSGPAYARSPNGKQLWLASHRVGRFDLSTETSSISPEWVDERAGTALAPIQLAGRLGVFTNRYTDKPGVSVTARDFNTKKVVWQTVLGTAWPLDPSPTSENDGLSIVSAEGKLLSVPKATVEQGGFVQMPLPRAGYFYVPATPLRRLDAKGMTILITAPDADHIYVRESTGKGDFQRVDLPAPLGAAPLFWGDDLFAPGLDGRVYLIDPKTGAAKAEPYVPPFERSKPTRWKNPVRLGDDAVILADETGRVRRLAKVTEPRLRLAVVGEVVDLKSTISVDPATTAEAVIVATDDGKVRALAARDLSSLGAWTLDAPRALGPVGVDGHALVIDAAGGVLAFGADGQKMWSQTLSDPPPLGPPILKDDALWFLSRDGALERRSLSDGTKLDRVDLGIQPTTGLNTDGPDTLVPSAPGTYRVLKADGEKVAQP